MNCPHCGRSTKMESEVELPMAIDQRYRDPDHWMTEAEAEAENASGPVQTWIDETTVRGYSGHSIIRVDPNHPDCQLYDEAMKPGRFEELAELESMVNPRGAAKRELSPEDEARIREELRSLGKQ